MTGDLVLVAELPISIDHVDVIHRVIGKAFPNSVIETGGPGFRIRIPAGDMFKVPTSRKAALVAPTEDDISVQVVAVREGTLGVEFPEWFSRIMTSMMAAGLDKAGAENFLAWGIELRDPGSDSWEQWEVVVRRPGGKMVAEVLGERAVRVEELEARVATLTARLHDET